MFPSPQVLGSEIRVISLWELDGSIDPCVQGRGAWPRGALRRCQRPDGSRGLAWRGWAEVNKIYITTRVRFIDGGPVTMLPMRAGKPSKTQGMEKWEEGAGDGGGGGNRDSGGYWKKFVCSSGRVVVVVVVVIYWWW